MLFYYFSLIGGQVNVFEGQVYMEHEAIKKSLNDYIGKMPALPTTISKILSICNDPKSSPADLSKVISLDPVLMGRVMKLINSAYYGMYSEITSLVRAIIMLGLNTVKNLALSTAVLGAVGVRNTAGLSSDGFWRHSLCVGVTAKLIAQKMGIPPRDIEEYFVAGLLHDIGKIPFNNKFPSEYSKCISLSESGNAVLFEMEKREFGCDHSTIGGNIATAWSLNEGLVHAISCHHEKDYSGEHKKLVYAVIVANYFATRRCIGHSGNIQPEEPDKEVFRHLGICWEDLEDMEMKIRESIEKANVFLKIAS